LHCERIAGPLSAERKVFDEMVDDDGCACRPGGGVRLLYGFAQPQSQPPQQPQDAGPQGMMQGRMTDHLRDCPMCGAMMGAMMLKTMIATPDGGVIVAFGNRLMRYDSQLNLIKETEMKIDAGQMYGDMQKMIESCPMCRQMPQQPAGQSPAQARP
jgi:hypothetical protein